MEERVHEGRERRHSTLGRSDSNPTFGAAALQNSFAKFHFVVAIGGGGEQDGRFTAARDVLVDGAILHLVAVRKAFGMASRIVSEPGDVAGKPRGGALKDLVRIIAAAEEDFVRMLEVPAHAAERSVNAQSQAAFPAGGDL